MTQSHGTSERRVVIRQPITLPVSVEVITAQDQARLRVEGWTRDLSNLGAFFRAPAMFKAGQKLRLVIEVEIESAYASSMEIHWDAEVVRVEPGPQDSGVAVRILQFDIAKVVTSPVTIQN